MKHRSLALSTMNRGTTIGSSAVPLHMSRMSSLTTQMFAPNQLPATRSQFHLLSFLGRYYNPVSLFLVTIVSELRCHDLEGNPLFLKVFVDFTVLFQLST